MRRWILEPTPQEQALVRDMQERFARLGEHVDKLAEERDLALAAFDLLAIEHEATVRELAEAHACIDGLQEREAA